MHIPAQPTSQTTLLTRFEKCAQSSSRKPNRVLNSNRSDKLPAPTQDRPPSPHPRCQAQGSGCRRKVQAGPPMLRAIAGMSRRHLCDVGEVGEHVVLNGVGQVVQQVLVGALLGQDSLQSVYTYRVYEWLCIYIWVYEWLCMYIYIYSRFL